MIRPTFAAAVAFPGLSNTLPALANDFKPRGTHVEFVGVRQIQQEHSNIFCNASLPLTVSAPWTGTALVINDAIDGYVARPTVNTPCLTQGTLTQNVPVTMSP